MTPDLTALIAEAKRLDGLATEGPWEAYDNDNYTQVQTYVDEDMLCVMGDTDARKEDAEFIAHSRTALPALVAEVERLRRCLDQAVDISELCLHYSAGASTPDGIDGYFDGWDPQPDGRPDLYAELKAREGR